MPRIGPEANPKGIQEALVRLLWNSQLRYFWIAFLVIGSIFFALWQSVPDKDKTEFLDLVFQNTNSDEMADLEVLPFFLSDASDEQAAWLKSKIERNMVELLSDARHKVSHKLSSNNSKKKARMAIAGSISRRNSHYMVSISLLENGLHLSSTDLEADFPLFEKIYKSIPEAIMYGMDIDVNTLTSLSSRTRPTDSVLAYALYLQARRVATTNKFDEANLLLDQAIAFDNKFAMAYWGKGELYRLLEIGIQEEDWKEKAQEIDSDHPRLPIYSKVQHPLPAIILAAKNTGWHRLNDGFSIRRIDVPGYEISIFAWSFDTVSYNLRVVSQLDLAGSTTAEIREQGSFVLAVNGGFFEIDSKYRLSPSGLLVVDSQLLSSYRKSAGSGVVFVKNNVLGIDWSKNFINPTGIFSAVQSNPLVVDPGGKNGIFKNDFNRLNRTAICLTPDRVVLIVVEGGMSLFELGGILSSSPSQGGFGCERALNLDGGPSTQASFMLDSQSQEIEGLWKIQNALVVSANGN